MFDFHIQFFYRIEYGAFRLLQLAGESFLISLLRDANRIAINSERKIVRRKDISLAYAIGEKHNGRDVEEERKDNVRDVEEEERKDVNESDEKHESGWSDEPDDLSNEELDDFFLSEEPDG